MGFPIALVLMVLAALLLPFFLTRAHLESVARGFCDPYSGEASQAVGWAAWQCLGLSLVAGVCFGAWCWHQSNIPNPDDMYGVMGWVWLNVMGLSVVPPIEVAVAISLPIHVSPGPTSRLGPPRLHQRRP